MEHQTVIYTTVDWEDFVVTKILCKPLFTKFKHTNIIIHFKIISYAPYFTKLKCIIEYFSHNTFNMKSINYGKSKSS